MPRQQGETLRRYLEYKKKAPVYKLLCEETVKRITKILNQRGIPFCSIESRVKSFNSMSEHLAKKPLCPGEFMKALRDTAGVRIVVWRPSDGEALDGDIHDAFNVESEKKEESKASGYRDAKYYCFLHARDLASRKLEKLKGLMFELQIQTALMNAWASIEHDVSYKGPYKLPEKYKNRFRSLAYLMDLGDDNLDTLTKAVASDAEGQSDTWLNTLGLKAYLDGVVETVDRKKKVLRMFRDWADARRLISELRKCGIRRLDDLKRVIDRDAVNQLVGKSRGQLDYSSLVRVSLVMKNPRNYFRRVMYEDIILEEDWLQLLNMLGVDYIDAARAVGKRVYIDTGTDCQEISTNRRNGYK